jgi:DNA helicase-2/ATP-dependent DNA helicase PcrA
MELGESPQAATADWSEFDAVNILTAHSSKGLEFSVVFLVNLTAERFPTRARNEQIPIPGELIKEILPEGNFHLEEERRLFYVGMTRAKDHLYMTVSNFYGEGKRERKISPFVFETIDEKDLLKAQNMKKDEKLQLSIFDFKSVETPTPKEKVSLTNFSYSQIDTYSTCPLRYKYQYILKVPTTANSAASFGDSIHQTLHQFYLGAKSGEDTSLETLFAIFKKLWVPLGYKSKVHEDRMKIEGQTFLKRFHETFFTKHAQVLDLEKWFRIKIGNDLFVTGKIDRVDMHPDGKIEIIDYKTGKVPKDEDLKKNLQLSMYALAASDPTLYKKSVENIVLTFYFLSENKKVSLQKTDEDLVKVKEKVAEIVSSIKEGSFEPKVGPWCSYCPFKINCEAWQ